MEKIVRSICYFTDQPGEKTCERVREIEQTLKNLDYSIQTLRICSGRKTIIDLESKVADETFLLSVGRMNREEAHDSIEDFVNSQ
ncbi:MAG: hypothetical protein HQ517_10965, partial [SAR324 cluster bacterium]|nr:hypothetical protein [SAR324 cluster bacterium]